MSNLRMNTTLTYDTGVRLSQFASQATEQADAVQRAVRSIEWESPRRDAFVGEVEAVVREIQQIAENFDQLGSRTRLESMEWEEAAAVFGVGAGLPSAAGGAAAVGVVGVQVYRDPDWLGVLPEGIRNNIHTVLLSLGLLPAVYTATAQYPGSVPSTPAPVSSSEPTALGKLLETEPVTPASSLAAKSHKVPVYGQGTLGGAAACNPTSMSMITNYWHAQDATNLAGTPKDLMQKAIDANYFVSGQGMDFRESQNLLRDMGYDANMISFENGSPQTDLQNALSNGPVMAMVNYDIPHSQLAASGDVHAVVVSGMSEDGSMVRVLDPWGEGRAVDLSWDKFNASWSSFEDGRGIDNMVVTVQPGAAQ